MREDTWDWFAGVFEGEGCMAFTALNSVCLTIHMTDQDIIHRCHRLADVGRVGVREREGCQPLWYWTVARAEEVAHVLNAIRPLMGQRRGDRADKALERLANVRMVGYCNKNHLMSGANLYITPKGQRMCRTCAKDRESKRVRV